MRDVSWTATRTFGEPPFAEARRPSTSIYYGYDVPFRMDIPPNMLGEVIRANRDEYMSFLAALILLAPLRELIGRGLINIDNISSVQWIDNFARQAGFRNFRDMAKRMEPILLEGARLWGKADREIRSAFQIFRNA